jgi:hypothetical protein
MDLSKIAVFAFVGLAGCNAHPGDAESSPHKGSADPAGSGSPSLRVAVDGAVALANVDENLARLRDLDLFEVGELIVNLPSEATNCYGLPCPVAQEALQAARVHGAERLANLAGAAERATATPYSGYACGTRIDVNLETLRSLEVVGIGAFVRILPENNPNCYNQPCPADIAAADARNEARAAELESIALAVQDI